MSEFKSKKPTRSTDHHLALLRERGLFINEENELNVKNSLRKIGYYRLSGYFGPLQKPKDSFKEGVRYDDIIRLYEFDKKLRGLTSNMLKTVEIELRARLTDIMSAVYESDWYVNEDLFILNEKKEEIVIEYIIVDDEIQAQEKKVLIPKYHTLLKEINKSLKKNEDKDYIVNFKDKYGSAVIPSWMMMECISFGALSRLFSLLKDTPEKKAVSRHFGTIMPDTFASWLHGFVIIRNACAHHSRLWNKKLTGDLMFPNKSTAKFINKTVENRESLRKFYGISSCLLRVLKEIAPEKHDFYKSEFYNIQVAHSIDLSAMGFPEAMEPYESWYV